MPIFGDALVPPAPHRPGENALYTLLGGQHKAPEEASNLPHTQGYSRPRAALKAARLLGAGWDGIFLGVASLGHCVVRSTVNSA